MKLYHGTNGALLAHIMSVGIRPRGARGRSNWKDTVESNPKCVYLTDSYAPYFALHASKGANPSCAVIEVETDRLDPADLFPDEDYLEQASRKIAQPVPGDMKARTRHYRRKQFTYNWPYQLPDGTFTTWWKELLQGLGTCSHRGPVPPSAITRAIWWPSEGNAVLAMVWDPTITLMNQQLVGDRYRALTRKLMAGEFTHIEEMRARHERVIGGDMEALRERFENPPLPFIDGWKLFDKNK